MLRKKLYIILLFLFIISIALQAQQPSVYKVSRLPFNSGAFSDISPVIVRDGIIFCSDRRFSAFTDRKTFEGRRLYNLYIIERRDSMDWGKPDEINSERSNLFNSGPLCFSPDGKTVYFTSEVETGKIARKKNFENHLGIFIGELSGTDIISIQPFPHNSSQYEVGHPSISNDGKYLFFASDMPGGQGGSDIYYCERDNGSWGSPLNMGPEINSPGSENYPFMHPSGRLYFSSDRPGGNGKLDVYYTMLTQGKWEIPSIVPEPVNSQYDDFAFVADEAMQTGYFASNRQKSDDIYRFVSTIIRKASCDTLVENNYCYEFLEENAVKWDTIPFRYEWKFGDGTTGAGAVVEHCYPGPGRYLIQLDVINLVTKEVMYNERTYSLEITDIEQPYITSPDQAVTDQRIRFSAEETNLPGWNIDRYYWNFGDETIAIGKEVDKAYHRPGTYNVQLIVSTEPDPGGVVREACICKNITITGQP